MYVNPWYGYYPYYPQQYGMPVFDQDGFRQEQMNQQQQQQMQQQQMGELPLEQSYIENILRLNLGKDAKVYMTFGNGGDQQSQVFEGRLEAAGRDHIIIVDDDTGRRYLLLMVYLDYVTFDEPLNYEYPFANEGESQQQLAQYPPR
ncbi:spore coat protein GerQ [Salicibibacter cibi]|uniref:Spore coat protein GerQ n=1 Tax=Salicibibacter cibi TaxID=2743001 RepID=A0A7T6ZE68_9BACI|nr:spore coat protein GerQ [Salicibibacter cibi]QQK81742.1 spore coat protein GerQ [Salicibibacter cibi]